MLENLLTAALVALAAYLVLRIVLAWRARIAPAEAHEKVEAGALLLDVRTEAEFGSGTIEGARNIPLASVPSSVGELDKDREIIVFCASGIRSARAAKLLRGEGFTVHDLGPKAAW